MSSCCFAQLMFWNLLFPQDHAQNHLVLAGITNFPTALSPHLQSFLPVSLHTLKTGYQMNATNVIRLAGNASIVNKITSLFLSMLALSRCSSRLYFFFRIIDRFYARDVKVVKTHWASETSTNDGVKMGRLRADDSSEKKKEFFLTLPVNSGQVGHKCVPVYGVPFLY